MLRRKHGASEKINAVKNYKLGASSQKEIAEKLGITKTSFQQWVRKLRLCSIAYKKIVSDSFLNWSIGLLYNQSRLIVSKDIKTQKVVATLHYFGYNAIRVIF